MFKQIKKLVLAITKLFYQHIPETNQLELPQEVWLLILSFLDTKALIQFGHVSRTHYRLSGEGTLWKPFVKELSCYEPANSQLYKSAFFTLHQLRRSNPNQLISQCQKKQPDHEIALRDLILKTEMLLDKLHANQIIKLCTKDFANAMLMWPYISKRFSYEELVKLCINQPQIFPEVLKNETATDKITRNWKRSNFSLQRNDEKIPLLDELGLAEVNFKSIEDALTVTSEPSKEETLERFFYALFREQPFECFDFLITYPNTFIKTLGSEVVYELIGYVCLYEDEYHLLNKLLRSEHNKMLIGAIEEFGNKGNNPESFIGKLRDKHKDNPAILDAINNLLLDSVSNPHPIVFRPSIS